jgi:hypothetical protein
MPSVLYFLLGCHKGILYIPALWLRGLPPRYERLPEAEEGGDRVARWHKEGILDLIIGPKNTTTTRHPLTPKVRSIFCLGI